MICNGEERLMTDELRPLDSCSLFIVHHSSYIVSEPLLELSQFYLIKAVAGIVARQAGEQIASLSPILVA